MSQQTGFVDKDKFNYVHKLRKAFHGLHQAPRALYDEPLFYLSMVLRTLLPMLMSLYINVMVQRFIS